MIAEGPGRVGAPLIAFAGGGTGGHLYPALAIADALRQRVPNVRFVFFGTQRRIDDRILAREDCEVVSQVLPPLSRLPWRWPKVYLGFRHSSQTCRSRFDMDPPMVVIGTGGLASVPAVREAVHAGIPTAILNPDALPGKANRRLATLVDVVFAQWEDTALHLPARAKVVVSGCPVRPEFNRADRAGGILRFGLDPRLKTLLVTGASQGAKTINEAVVAQLGFLESRPGWQILHLTGETDHDEVRRGYEGRPIKRVVAPYTDHMADALAAADLVISRAGASTLAEITALGRPSILMPYPYDKHQHQMGNARCLARASAARIVRDAVEPTMNGPALRQALEPLMADDDQRASMAAAARRIGRGHAASDIAEHLLRIAEHPSITPLRESVEAACEHTR